MSKHTFAALVRKAVIAEGGKHSINIADGSEIIARALEELSTWPIADVLTLVLFPRGEVVVKKARRQRQIRRA